MSKVSKLLLQEVVTLTPKVENVNTDAIPLPPAVHVTYEEWSKPAEIRAYCAWEVHGGVNITLENPHRIGKYATGGTIELTVKEAFDLAQSLIQAAYDTMRLDSEYMADMAKEEIERLKNDVYEPATDETF